ncbi:TIGR01244 family sulfur transferase [Methylovorus glucosotrophus]|uniref:Beta-lactamase hydrolase-like protein phosphatase-like domain-containing protein n=1 Tax=Methylovorus glucosotrophus (strain SIP3-4) TaxID=582744 RepID=C6XE52_METGS|nr:TIGR01244 family sulfur transferase [Methylovorus glucosotrophus]ACT50827.1 protein of unknown function DUF442 [Methylovorus glucosotrophus SIP3-4]
MAIHPVKVDDAFSHCTQVMVDDIPEIVAAGYKTLINNRPDGEDGASQPTTPVLRAAAEAAGLQFIAFPVIPNQITAQQVAEYKHLIAHAPRPILGFCRSGNRASTLYLRAKMLYPQDKQYAGANTPSPWSKAKELIRAFWNKEKDR